MCCVDMASHKYSYFSVCGFSILYRSGCKEFASTRPCKLLYKHKYKGLLVIFSPSSRLLKMVTERTTCYSKGGKRLVAFSAIIFNIIILYMVGKKH